MYVTQLRDNGVEFLIIWDTNLIMQVANNALSYYSFYYYS